MRGIPGQDQIALMKPWDQVRIHGSPDMNARKVGRSEKVRDWLSPIAN